MEVISHKLPRNGVVIDTGDWHFGSSNCVHDGIDRMLSKLRKKNHYIILKGDLMETISPDDKRFNLGDRNYEMLRSGEQRAAIIATLKPYRKKILALGIGNHEFKDDNTEQHGKHMCTSLGCPYGAYTFVIEFRDKDTGKVMFKTFHTHGNGSLKSSAKDKLQQVANKKASLKQKLINTDIADCVYMSMGHTHQLLTVEPNYDVDTPLTTSMLGTHQHDLAEINQNAKYIPPDQRFYANTGSFLKLYSKPGLGIVPYGERAMFKPAGLGWVEFEFKDGRIIDVREVKT